MKKKIFTVLCILLMGIFLIGCGNGGTEKKDASVLASYLDIRFSISAGDGGNADTIFAGEFPESWQGETIDTMNYYEYFRKLFAFGSKKLPVVKDGATLTMDFDGYQPDKITVMRDPNTFDILSAKQTPDADSITNVNVKDNSFTVEYEDSNMLYYLIRCEWDGVGVVTYGVALSSK